MMEFIHYYFHENLKNHLDKNDSRKTKRFSQMVWSQIEISVYK